MGIDKREKQIYWFSLVIENFVQDFFFFGDLKLWVQVRFKREADGCHVREKRTFLVLFLGTKKWDRKGKDK